MKILRNLSKPLIVIFPIFLLAVFSLLLFSPFIFHGKLPIPADTIVGMYQPWRDFNIGNYPSGVPFKNSLITDPVRQQFPWRQLSINLLKNKQLPLWNPYNFSGTPLLSNIQSAPLYPLNIIYLVTSFENGWAIQIILQILLGGAFMCFLLKKYKLHWLAVSLGTISWVGSGFFVAWMEWNTIIQTVLWLPLILLATDNIFSSNKKFKWVTILSFALVCNILAGHLQTLFYVWVLFLSYLSGLLVRYRSLKSTGFVFLGVFTSLLLVFPYLNQIFRFIYISARGLDIVNWETASWFLPAKHIAQLFAPDFFGNPATLNYFGDWNYGEFVSYVGIIPLIFVMYMLFSKKNLLVMFYILVCSLSLVFALPTVVAKIPFILSVPLISTSQPSRLIALFDFSLVVLAAFGLDRFIKDSDKKKTLVSVISIFVPLATLVIVAYKFDQAVSLRNMFVPVSVFFMTSVFLMLGFWKRNLKIALLIVVVSLSFVDSYRFASKFESFSDTKYLYPQTKLTEFLQTNTSVGNYRVAMENDSIMPPNFNLPYKIQTIAGYDPLYFKSYGELIYSMQNNKPYYSGMPLNFNRILIPNNFESPIFDLLGVRYYLSSKEIDNQKLSKVLSEGSTFVYENVKVLPRTFFVESVLSGYKDSQILDNLISSDFDPRKIAFVSSVNFGTKKYGIGEAFIEKYSENEILIKTHNSQNGFMILTDTFYPGWRAQINGKNTKIYLTDYIFRGVEVPAGDNLIRFSIGL